MSAINQRRVISCLPLLLFLAIGCYCFFPKINPAFLVLCMGIAVIITALSKLFCYFSKDTYQLAFQFDFGLGIFFLTMGVLLVVSDYFLTILSFCMMIDAVLKIQTALEAKSFGLQKWWCILILAVLAAVSALLLMIVIYEKFFLRFNPLYLLGFIFILNGGLNLFTVLYTVKEPGK